METTTMTKIGDKVDLGGAVGSITKVSNDHILVEGTYYYSDGESGAFPEPYSCYIPKEDLLYDEKWRMWKVR